MKIRLNPITDKEQLQIDIMNQRIEIIKLNHRVRELELLADTLKIERDAYEEKANFLHELIVRKEI